MIVLVIVCAIMISNCNCNYSESDDFENREFNSDGLDIDSDEESRHENPAEETNDIA